ncbi:MAG TPA: hypothetical protein VEJ47_22740 [Candidatus Eremiobacteraceae bacterium]|nr:hypothetical protein [Candidatus Eremiobacteraceae bacterium]
MIRSRTISSMPRKTLGPATRQRQTFASFAQRRGWQLLLALSLILAGCGSETTKPAADAQKKTAELAVPDDIQDAAHALLGSETQVLLFGDLAKNGLQQFLAANVVPNTPKSTVAGIVVTRAVIAQNEDGKWVELFRADEYLKNQKGYLALTPLQPVTGWKLQYENTPDTGMSLYITPVKQGSSERTLPIAVRWNPANKRYQSMDASYQHFLNEAPSLQSPRVALL